MKTYHSLFLILIASLTMIASCKKENTLEVELAKLPPATQTGANTFGCLVNGKAWVAQNKDCIILCDPSFDTYYDTFNGGFIALSAFLKDNANNLDEEIDIAFDSTDFKKVFSFVKGKNDLNIRFLNFKGTTYNTVLDSSIKGNCNLEILNYDLRAGIISGSFEFTLSKPGHETIKITNGRFDSKL
ncbi:MAG: hypothetical protein JSS98_12935 [Bacteroidetes bacterium]|nr:hypothetical protein [Bacteroidota bacterium]